MRKLAVAVVLLSALEPPDVAVRQPSDAAERFALVHALPKKGTEPESDDDSPAWTLFEDPLAVQHAMTAQVRENVRVNLGVEIAAPATA